MIKVLIRVLVVVNVLVFLQVVWPLAVQRPPGFPARAQMLNVIERLRSGPLAEMRDKGPSQSGIAVFVNQVSTTCASGRLLRFADSLVTESMVDRVIAVVPNSFTHADAENLRRQLGLTFEVVIADDDLSNKWIQLSQDFSWRAVNGLAFLFTESGTEVFQGQPQLEAGLAAHATGKNFQPVSTVPFNQKETKQ